MWRDKLAQGCLISSRRQVALWCWYQKLGTSSFIGIVIIIAISTVRKVPALAVILSDWQVAPANSPLESTLNKGTTSHYFLVADSSRIVSDLPNTLPSNYFSVNQSNAVNVPVVQRSAQLPSLPSTTLPPTIFPTNQTPSVSVPPLQPIPTSTPTPRTTSQPRENPPKSASPALSSPLIIEFGQPLPRATSEVSMPRRQRTIPSLESGAVVEP
jgi:hypothetical protein